MPKKTISTPTLTESRAKRTPKPNPKYAVDYVAKLRYLYLEYKICFVYIFFIFFFRISPDRKTEDDDDYTPVSKKRNEDDSSRDVAALSKSTKKKLVAKSASTPEPKKSVSKTNAQTPIMSRLSTLRNVPKRGSPVPVAKNTIASRKSTPVSSKSSPTLSVSKSSNAPEKKTTSTTSEIKIVSPSLETKTSVVSTLKRTAKNESTIVQKVSPVAKVTKKGDKVVNDEIRIVNISDIMKQTEIKKVSDDVKSTKKQKLDSEEIEIIDIEEEISVSSALVRPTTRQKVTVVDKLDTKAKLQVKTAQLPSNVQHQLSTIGQKRKLSVTSPQTMPSKSSPTLITKSKTQINKNSPSFKMRKFC